MNLGFKQMQSVGSDESAVKVHYPGLFRFRRSLSKLFARLGVFQTRTRVRECLEKLWKQERAVVERDAVALLSNCRDQGVVAVTVRLSPQSPLYGGEEAFSIDLPIDQVITPFVMENGHWQLEELEFFSSHLPCGPCILLDIGANVGLVSRQMLHRFPSIKSAICFEPNPNNHSFLCRNLRHLPQCVIIQAALGNVDGTVQFFEDNSNIGNYSLNKDAMRGKSFSVTHVPCLKASTTNLLGSLPKELSKSPILWKSDTQGFDEVIITTLPDVFWSQVHAGVMELWRIRKPSIDYNRLASILDSFPTRCYSDNPGKNISTAEIIEYCQGNDYSYKDLLFSR